MLFICIEMHVSSYQLLIVPVCCNAVAERCSPLLSRPSLPAVLTCLVTYDRKENDSANSSLSRQTLLSEDRRCWQSCRDAELGDGAVCAVTDPLETHGEGGSQSQSDTTGEDMVLVRCVVLLWFLPHRDTAVSCLTNDTQTTSSSSTDCYDDWRQASPTICRSFYDASSPFRDSHLLPRCHDASAALRLLPVAGNIFCAKFSVVYYVTDSVSLWSLPFYSCFAIIIA